ncbi:MAG: phenylalanine 4-monooxygenase [Gammaproteobacteria bacterium]|nr:phenylalanine 4-monooxygenase [Gammaproteobacteria bacterium]
MGKGTKYASKKPDENGLFQYTDEENSIWRELILQQKEILPGRACDEYMEALERMNFPEDRVPQVKDVSEVLRKHTGWEVAPVPALINFDKFFALLADKKFPAATFIRTREEMEYLQEPDVFHEIFGHTPLLTDSRFAEFTHAYGKAGLKASKEDRVMLARLYWFTVEFGLINTAKGLRTYGAGIVSSIGETPYSIESDVPQRKPFDPVDLLRTPYRIDIFQTVYFVIDSLDDLFEVAHMDLFELIEEARRLGMHEPTFPPKEEKQAS